MFAGFIFTADPVVKSIALALTVGALLDAFVVRLTLVPAAMAVLGRYAWFLPSWLDCLLPTADIEGASLPELAAHTQTAAPQRPETPRDPNYNSRRTCTAFYTSHGSM